MVFATAAGSAPDLASFSTSVSNTAATCSQVGNVGGALASLSCSPKTFRYGSPESVASCHADRTAGRSVVAWYHLTCTSGRDSHWMNFHAPSRFFASLNTARLLPPMNDVADLRLGIGATANLSPKPAPPWSLSRPTCHGPDMNAAMSPRTKPGSSAPSGSSVGASFPVKKDW